MNLSSIYKLELLNFMFKFKNKTLPKCFDHYCNTPSQTHDYPTRFACADYCAATFVHKKSTTQRSIQCNGYKIWNNLPSEIKELKKKLFCVFKKVYIGKITNIVHFAKLFLLMSLVCLIG